MKRVFKISDAVSRSKMLSNLHRHRSKPKALTPPSLRLPNSSLYRFYGDSGDRTHQSPLPVRVINLVIEKLSQAEEHKPIINGPSEDLKREVILFRDKLLKKSDSLEEVINFLNENAHWLLGKFAHSLIIRTGKDDDRAFSHLFRNLYSSPDLAMEVFNWRKQKDEEGFPLSSEEYVNGITIAGRMRNVDLAAELFSEAARKQLCRTATYNALMGAYMYNGLTEKCQLVFRDLKREMSCRPSIVTYNILISVFGRLMLIDHMEATFQEIQNLNLSPTVSTYNSLIYGYLIAWMWDSMERTFYLMKTRALKPDIFTYLLMLRGYAHSGKLEQMEETYQMIKHHVDKYQMPLIRTMICAYCKSSVKDRTKRIEELLKLIPKNQFRPWLNALLIRVYAQENCLESMENWINEAFESKTSLRSLKLMQCIIAAYFRCNDVDRMRDFLKRAESAGWRIGRSLYHSKMVMYGIQKRFKEMENVLNEMEDVNLDYSKKTFWILCKAYSMSGKRHKFEQVMGLTCKNGYGIPLCAKPS